MRPVGCTRSAAGLAQRGRGHRRRRDPVRGNDQHLRPERAGSGQSVPGPSGLIGSGMFSTVPHSLPFPQTPWSRVPEGASP